MTNEIKPLTPDEVREIRERAEKATKGPWKSSETSTGRFVIDSNRIWVTGKHISVCVKTPSSFYAKHIIRKDFDFIAHSREDVPALCDAVLAAWDEIATLRATVAEQAAMIEEAKEMLSTSICGWKCPACGVSAQWTGMKYAQRHDRGCRLAAWLDKVNKLPSLLHSDDQKDTNP